MNQQKSMLFCIAQNRFTSDSNVSMLQGDWSKHGRLLIRLCLKPYDNASEAISMGYYSTSAYHHYSSSNDSFICINHDGAAQCNCSSSLTIGVYLQVGEHRRFATIVCDIWRSTIIQRFIRDGSSSVAKCWWQTIRRLSRIFDDIDCKWMMRVRFAKLEQSTALRMIDERICCHRIESQRWSLPNTHRIVNGIEHNSTDNTYEKRSIDAASPTSQRVTKGYLFVNSFVPTNRTIETANAWRKASCRVRWRSSRRNRHMNSVERMNRQYRVCRYADWWTCSK